MQIVYSRLIFLPMKKIGIILLLFVFVPCAQSQSRVYPFYQLYQLDSIGASPSVSQHFGKLYADFLRLVEKRLEKADTMVKRLLRVFEEVFAQFFIDAAEDFAHHKPIRHPSWKKYFEDTTLSSAQYFLLGANAHLNGQLSMAIYNSYSPHEWKLLKSHYDLFNKCLNETYRHVYRETIYEHPRAQTLHLITFGLDKILGNYFLYKWRKRQMRVTEYRFSNSSKYQRLSDKIERKKNKVDRLIIVELADRTDRTKKKG